MHVSILTRSHDRVQRGFGADTIEYNPSFQSSPDLTTGCNNAGVRDACPALRFNPHPISRPGATYPESMPAEVRFCFNPHPISRPGATPASKAVRLNLLIVSILTRSHDRVQRAGAPSVPTPCMFQSSPDLTTGCNGAGAPSVPTPCMFQSSPDLTTGCNACFGEGGVCLSNGFNPHPISRPGATWRHGLQFEKAENVSILTRSHDRVQREIAADWHGGQWFQSSPDLTTGCNYLVSMITGYIRKEFQSSPDLTTGCNVRSRGRYRPRWGCFNPHPISRPGATHLPRAPRPRGRCFNPHPISRPGATMVVDANGKIAFGFQSSPDLTTGCNRLAASQTG